MHTNKETQLAQMRAGPRVTFEGENVVVFFCESDGD